MMIRLRLMFFLMLVECTVMAAKLESLVVQENGGKTVINCTVKGLFKYKAFVLNNPSRVVIDFEQTTAMVNLKNVMLGRGLLTNLP